MTVRIYQQKITHVVFIKDGQFSPTSDFTPRTVFTPQGSYTPQYDYTPQADYTVQGDYTPQGDFTVQTNFKVQGDFTPQGDYSFSFDRGIGASSNFGGYGDGKYNQNDIDVDTYEALQKMREMKMREVDLAAVSAAFIVFLEKASVVWGFQAIVTHLEVQKNWMLFRKKSLELKRAQIIEATTDIESQNVWCADYTTELSGEVDSIEINGAPNQILIGPGGVNVLRDAIGGVGRLSNIMVMSSAQAALAWALLPGWQKWRPTYRIGTVSVIDYEADTATVAFAEPFSAAQNLPINQTSYLYQIPVEYMTCNSAAFAVGDKVVVEFQGAQKWLSEPKVIGFESNPKPCDGNNICIGGRTFSDHKGIVKLYDREGNKLWETLTGYDGAVQDVFALKDRVYVADYDYDIGGVNYESDGKLMCLDALSGAVLWEKTGLRLGVSVCADNSGVYLSAGYAEPFWTLKSTISKYSSGGSLLWSNSYSVSAPWYINNFVEIDISGAVYVIGYDNSGGCYRRINPINGNTISRTGHSLTSKWYDTTVMARDGHAYMYTVTFPDGIGDPSVEVVESLDTVAPVTAEMNLDLLSIWNDGDQMAFFKSGESVVISRSEESPMATVYDVDGSEVINFALDFYPTQVSAG